MIDSPQLIVSAIITRNNETGEFRRFRSLFICLTPPLIAGIQKCLLKVCRGAAAVQPVDDACKQSSPDCSNSNTTGGFNCVWRGIWSVNYRYSFSATCHPSVHLSKYLIGCIHLCTHSVHRCPLLQTPGFLLLRFVGFPLKKQKIRRKWGQTTRLYGAEISGGKVKTLFPQNETNHNMA